MNVKLLTLYDAGYAQVGDQCAKSLRTHAAALGVGLDVYTELLDPGVHPSWNKIAALQTTLSDLQDGDWAVWIDADCLLLRPFALVDDLGDKLQFDLLGASDWNGLCACVLAVKKCAWTDWFLPTLSRCGDVKDDDRYGAALGPKWEQNTIKGLLNEFPAVARRISFLDSNWIADMPWYDPERLKPLHHFGALTQNQRLSMMREYPYGVA